MLGDDLDNPTTSTLDNVKFLLKAHKKIPHLIACLCINQPPQSFDTLARHQFLTL